eukprot:g2694.t1
MALGRPSCELLLNGGARLSHSIMLRRKKPVDWQSTVIGKCAAPENCPLTYIALDENESVPVVAPILDDIDQCTELTISNQSDTVTPVEQNIIGEFWDRYCEALDKNPIPVKSATSFFGFLLGDIFAQLVSGGDFEAVRTFRMVLFGVLMDGPIGHVWYSNIDRLVMPSEPTAPKAVFIKTCLDQLAWAPFFNCVFIAFIDILKGHPMMIPHTIRMKFGKTMMANYALWPLAHVINFRFVPSKQRILYINAVQICWTTYLSYLVSSKLH